MAYLKDVVIGIDTRKIFTIQYNIDISFMIPYRNNDFNDTDCLPDTLTITSTILLASQRPNFIIFCIVRFRDFANI